MALKPCRECNALVSTEAGVCPRCGVSKPMGDPLAKKRKGGSGCLVPFFLFVITISVIAALFSEQETPEERAQKLAQKEKRDAAFSADLDALRKAGELAIISGDANKFELSGWNSSLDLYIGTRLTLKAASLARFFCHQYFAQLSPPLKHAANWKIRVFLVDGSVGAECSIR